MTEHTYFVKVVCGKDDDYLLVSMYRSEGDYDEKLVLPRKEMDKITEKMKDIQLGLTDKNTNTLDPDVIDIIEQHHCHPALVDFYMTPGGNQYRWCMSRHEREYTIQAYEEEQEYLKKKIADGYKTVSSAYLTEQIAEAQGRIPCIGKEGGCPEYTNGSQFCRKTFCPYFVE